MGSHFHVAGQFLQHVPAAGIVIDHEDGCVFQSAVHAGDGGGDAGHAEEGDRDEELAALAEFAFHADASAHQLDELLADRQPESAAAEPPCDGTVHLHEGFKNRREPVRGYADAGIGNGDAHRAGFFCRQVQSHPDHDLALHSKLERIAQEIEDHLPQPRTVADNFCRYP